MPTVPSGPQREVVHVAAADSMVRT